MKIGSIVTSRVFISPTIGCILSVDIRFGIWVKWIFFDKKCFSICEYEEELELITDIFVE